ncbi:putative glutamyl-tRNA amidotransferase subunit A [Viridothelium virens]|uniref:amidase n=1 Tax=Viridothelium virens TaxID=1048519 RepID=A0A6A6GVH4_VIRVR|nr:putative glutamyl-tRNA amidotransferase subunit A [Viridothelium virens]
METVRSTITAVTSPVVDSLLPSSRPAKPWQEVAKEAQEHRDQTIAAVQPDIPNVPDELPLNVTAIPTQLLTAEELEITGQTAEQLLPKLASGKLSSVAVVNAFLRRAGLAQKLTNCITELLPHRALSRAAYLDDYLATHGRPIGPLHGLPISVKEHIGIRGLDLNAGFVSCRGEIASQTAHILQILHNAGAVFHARTTEPQTLMHLETSSNLYGETVNPFNRALTCGGSSGGEGALLALKGSCLGIGTDIGGSIRSPAGNNGVYGLRPTSFRLPIDGWKATMAGAEAIIPVIGPLSRSLEGLKIFMTVILDAKPWLKEPSLVPFGWREGLQVGWFGWRSEKRRLKIAVLWDDEVVKPHPPVTRALNEVVEKLRHKEGITIVDWKPFKHDLAWDVVASLYFCDGAADESSCINASGEPWRPLSNFIITDNAHVKEHTIFSLWEWTIKREEYKSKYAELWNQTASNYKAPLESLRDMVDVILCPVGPGAAPPLDCARYWGYTSQWNLLDYPAVVFPAIQADPEIDKADEGYISRNEQDEYNHKLYEPEEYRDAPVSLQLVARRYEDEKVMEALEIIRGTIDLPFSKGLSD